MATRNVVLTDHQDRLINALVAEGIYQNASEIIREGLRAVERRVAADARLRAAAKEGADAIARGDYLEFDDVEDLIAHLDATSFPESQPRP